MPVDRSRATDRPDRPTPAAARVPPVPADGPPGWLFVPPVVVGVVLRCWALGATGLSADELFTATHANLPWSDIVSRIADEDTHGPLDFLLRHPVAGFHDAFALRVPSALLATATLLLVWHWGRRQGWLGFWFVTLTALSSFEVLYARTARPYALLILCGTVVAFAADSWLREDRATGWAVVAGAATVVALFTDPTGGLLVIGGVLLPGRARDAAAWKWRGSMVVAGVAFAAGWGWVSLHQYTGTTPAHIPLADPVYAVREVGRLAAVVYPDNGFVLVPLLIAGVVALRGLDRRLGWTVISLGVVPVAVAVVAAFGFHFLFARSLSAVAWSIPLGLAAAIEWARRRGTVYGVLVVAALAILMLPSVPYALTYDEEVQATGAYLQSVVEPGDGVVVFPGAISHIVEWPLAVDHRATGIPGYQDPEVASDPKRAYATLVPGASFTGRVFVVGSDGVTPALPGRACASIPPRRFGDFYTVSCRQLTN